MNSRCVKSGWVTILTCQYRQGMDNHRLCTLHAAVIDNDDHQL